MIEKVKLIRTETGRPKSDSHVRFSSPHRLTPPCLRIACTTNFTGSSSSSFFWEGFSNPGIYYDPSVDPCFMFKTSPSLMYERCPNFWRGKGQWTSHPLSTFAVPIPPVCVKSINRLTIDYADSRPVELSRCRVPHVCAYDSTFPP